jgi:hypothetical protein
LTAKWKATPGRDVRVGIYISTGRKQIHRCHVTFSNGANEEQRI